MAEVLSGVMGQNVSVKPMNWLPLKLAAPFWPMGRSLLEMRYLWDTPHRLDGARFAELVPGFQATAAQDVLRACTAHL